MNNNNDLQHIIIKNNIKNNINNNIDLLNIIKK